MSTETLQITPESTSGAEEAANKAALAAVEQHSSEPSKSPAPAGDQETKSQERPDWLPEKFSTPEDMAKAYSELETKQGSKDATIPSKKTESETEAPSLDAFAQEFNESGELSKESYDQLETMGIPKPFVDQYVTGLEASQNALFQAVTSEAGGEDGYTKLTDWASNNLTGSQQDAFNAQVSSGNLDAAKMAVAGLQAQYQKATGSLGEGFQVSSGKAPSANTFASVAEMQAAMSDPRYANDPAYRNDVANRLRHSNIL